LTVIDFVVSALPTASTEPYSMIFSPSPPVAAEYQ
jgi:hypothetical protein